ncbi:helix-hairpin-helix domain-containing protein [Oceanicaulis sp.]|uniref:helix-hairpin-helix domain-containing protein n=1 Tax=Oceanicaulis sp. TaxID=1924941 RepID=UPI003BAC8082
MMWLIWNMWILLLLAFIGGVVTGWILHGKSDETPKSGPRGLLEPAQGPHSHASSATVDAEPLKAEPAAPKKRAADLLQEAAPDLVASTDTDASAETSGAAEPVTETAPVSDDLTKIKGLGPKAAAKLSENGVTSLAQIANWTADDVARMDDLINGRGRIERDDWVGQAKALSA